MIVQTKNGIMLHGEIAKDPVLRDIGQKRVLKFDLKASRTQDETGKWQSFFVGVNLWHGIDQWDGMLQKGDQVTVFAQKLKEREYNGKTYYASAVHADDVIDTMGAGDSYFAAFLCSLLKSSKSGALLEGTEEENAAHLQEAMQIGAAFAAKMCAKEGAFGYGTPIVGRTEL